MNEKCLALFLREIFIITEENNMYVTDELISKLNDFIYSYYQANPKLFSIIFPNDSLVEKCIKNNYQIMPTELVIILLQRYYGLDSYLKLLEDIDPEIDHQINELAIMFLNYRSSLVELSNEKYTGYQRILQ